MTYQGVFQQHTHQDGDERGRENFAQLRYREREREREREKEGGRGEMR